MSDKSGIYAIRHIESNRLYIGSAVDLKRRRREHFRRLRANSHKNPKLQNAWNKYGECEFEFVILKNCGRDDLIANEQKFIDIFDAANSGFNILSVAGSTLGYKHTEETKAHLSVVNSGYKHTEDSKELMRGRVVSDETRDALSKAHTGKSMSQDQRDAIGRAHKGRIRTQEERDAISRGKTGMPRPPITEQTRERIRIAQRLRREREKTNV